jgi:hypothetical protein
MVHPNPGEAPPETKFSDALFLRSLGYTGQVIECNIEGVPTFDALSADVVPAGSPARIWAEEQAAKVDLRIRAAKEANTKIYAWMQCLVFPKRLLDHFQHDLFDEKGHLDIGKAQTQHILELQVREILTRFSGLDGLVIRTGEVYLHDLPYHATAINSAGGSRQAGTAILHGIQSHIALLRVLRQEVCVNANKTLIYRTWDFGNNFHTNRKYYLAVTNAILPLQRLFFSIKHTAGDFHQLTPFNPTLGIGNHQQIVEAQCQREGYGKGAHPYYIGEGVINGWEEYSWLENPGDPKGLRDLSGDRIKGLWTWSRGGGWDGPYVTNEFWCALNARILARYANEPSRTEQDLFTEECHTLGLRGSQVDAFRSLCVLSTKAVLRGQLTALGAEIDVWWARDDKLGEPNLSDFIEKGLINEAIEEKQGAVAMWREIERLSANLQFPTADLTDFVRVSCTYGRIKYSIIEHGWTALLITAYGQRFGTYDLERISTSISAYDAAWREWQSLKATAPLCSTLSHDFGFDGRPGLGAAIDRCRKLVAT